MLFIEKIDDCNFRVYGDSISKSGLKIVSMKVLVARAMEPAYNETQGRIRIFDSEKEEYIVNHKPVSQITLDGVVYITAAGFVQAFNTTVNECCCEDGSMPSNTTSTTEEPEVTTTTEAENTTTTTLQIG